MGRKSTDSAGISDFTNTVKQNVCVFYQVCDAAKAASVRKDFWEMWSLRQLSPYLHYMLAGRLIK